MKNIRLGDVLVSGGVITEDQLGQALAYQKSHRDMRIGAILIEMGFVSEKQMLWALGQRLNLKTVDMSDITVDLAAVRKVPHPLAMKYKVLAVKSQDGELTVVTNDPLDFYALEDIRQVTGENLVLLLSEVKPLEAAIEYYYSEVEAKAAAETANQADIGRIEELDIEDGDDDAPIIKLLTSLVQRAYATSASDIHIEPFEDKTYVRMRIDGVIVDYVTLQKTLHSTLIARIKIIAALDIAEKRIPQDGHFKTKIGDQNLNIRVSILPTVFGEKAVLRLLAATSYIDRSGQYGMNDSNYEKFARMLQHPNGIIYITGPTGSGKTTTLYMVLEQFAKRPLNISTIEDPVEKNLARINQTQVNNVSGLTFEAGLRALLRQDPDVIMVGETRDAETASISVRAAITGHLVFSTLHTNDAVSTIVRLEDMGLESYMVANSLVGIVAQRLMRKVCPVCGYNDEPTAVEKKIMGRDIPVVRRGKGCHQCNNTGYKGRIAIHETLFVDKPLRSMIARGCTMEEVTKYAEETQDFVPLKEAALDLIEQGITTVDELLKVAYYL